MVSGNALVVLGAVGCLVAAHNVSWWQRTFRCLVVGLAVGLLVGSNAHLAVPLQVEEATWEGAGSNIGSQPTTVAVGGNVRFAVWLSIGGHACMVVWSPIARQRQEATVAGGGAFNCLFGCLIVRLAF